MPESSSARVTSFATASPSAAGDDDDCDLDEGPIVIAWRCGYCRCSTHDISRRDCDFCLSESPDRYLVHSGPIDHIVPAYGRLSILFGASPIDDEAPRSLVGHNLRSANEVDASVIAWECGFCKCTTKDLDRRDCPFCLIQVATRYAISRGSFDDTIGRVVIIWDDSPMDDDNAQLWESVLTHK
jgi:hypothetical protein